MKTLAMVLLVLTSWNIQSHSQELASNQKVHPEVSPSLPDATSKMAVFNFEVYNQLPEELKKINSDQVSSHFLGEDIAREIYILEEGYTYEVPVAPGNPSMKTMFRKPAIYNAVHKIEKALRKSIKNGEMTQEEAKGKFSRVLEVAINIKNAKTDHFEEALKDFDKIQDQLGLFLAVNLTYTNQN